jgi:hypothetical protein
MSARGQRLDFAILFGAKNKEKSFKIRRFRSFLVDISGIEPLTS